MSSKCIDQSLRLDDLRVFAASATLILKDVTGCVSGLKRLYTSKTGEAVAYIPEYFTRLILG